jgi:hypothetical protein
MDDSDSTRLLLRGCQDTNILRGGYSTDAFRVQTGLNNFDKLQVLEIVNVNLGFKHYYYSTNF